MQIPREWKRIPPRTTAPPTTTCVQNPNGKGSCVGSNDGGGTSDSNGTGAGENEGSSAAGTEDDDEETPATGADDNEDSSTDRSDDLDCIGSQVRNAAGTKCVWECSGREVINAARTECVFKCGTGEQAAASDGACSKIPCLNHSVRALSGDCVAPCSDLHEVMEFEGECTWRPDPLPPELDATIAASTSLTGICQAAEEGRMRPMSGSNSLYRLGQNSALAVLCKNGVSQAITYVLDDYTSPRAVAYLVGEAGVAALCTKIINGSIGAALSTKGRSLPIAVPAIIVCGVGGAKVIQYVIDAAVDFGQCKAPNAVNTAARLLRGSEMGVAHMSGEVWPVDESCKNEDEASPTTTPPPTQRTQTVATDELEVCARANGGNLDVKWFYPSWEPQPVGWRVTLRVGDAVIELDPFVNRIEPRRLEWDNQGIAWLGEKYGSEPWMVDVTPVHAEEEMNSRQGTVPAGYDPFAVRLSLDYGAAEWAQAAGIRECNAF